ncbi:MAG TPA: pitrilysin family protein [Gemmatimonadaceae bacterium]|nr:pitrilysin family protein [Gemmatimonadaceae bacterium]
MKWLPPAPAPAPPARRHRRALGVLLVGTLLVLSAAALPARSSPARPPVFQADTSTSEFMVGGVHVILRRNTANDVVAANLYLLGGVQQLTAATQGIEPFLLASSERGTRHYPKEALRTKMNRLGSTIVIEPEDDWTIFGLRAIRTTFDSSWMILADRVMYPTLDSTEVELVRGQLLASVRQARLQPDVLLRQLADSLLYQGHPYALAPDGTEQALSTITVAMLRDYEARQMLASRMLLVVVGNVERPQLEALVRGTLARLPSGSYRWQAPSPVTSAHRALLVEPMSLPTNYILGYYAGPPAGSRDYTALRVATAVLSGRFFTEIRSKRNLSYAVDAPFVERAQSTGGVYVTTVDPDQTLRVMRDQLDELQREIVDPEGLKRLVQQFITDYFLKNETNADQATFLARAAVYQGDYRAANRFVDELRQVQPADVRRAAREYMHDFRFVYLGDPAKLTRGITERF